MAYSDRGFSTPYGASYWVLGVWSSVTPPRRRLAAERWLEP